MAVLVGKPRPILPVGQSQTVQSSANAPYNVRPEWAGLEGGYTRPNVINGDATYFTWQPRNPFLRDPLPAGSSTPNPVKEAEHLARTQGMLAQKMQREQLKAQHKSQRGGILDAEANKSWLNKSPDGLNALGEGTTTTGGRLGLYNPTGLLGGAINNVSTTPGESMGGVKGTGGQGETTGSLGNNGVGTYDPSILRDPTKWNITPEQTVQGQIRNIVAEDSPLMQQAATAGLQQANSRGLLNSGMAIGNARDAVYRTALPIATSDADVNARAAGYNADESNKFSISNQAARNQALQFGAGNKFAASESAAERALKTQLQESQQNWQGGQNAADRALTESQNLFQANVEATIHDLDNQANFDKNLVAVYGNASQELIRQMAAINADTNMDQASKDYAINQLVQTNLAMVSMLSAVGTIPDVSTLVKFEQPVQYTDTDIKSWLAEHPNATDAQIAQAMSDYGITAKQMAAAVGMTEEEIIQRMKSAGY